MVSASDARAGHDPAAALLLWTARVTAKSGSAPSAPVEQMTEAAWRRFLAEAVRHGVVPVTAAALAGNDGVPPAIAIDLAAARDHNARRSLALTGELVTVVDQLAAIGVPALPWKGPTLAARAYGDVGARYFFDLDLLVRPVQFRAARDLLLASGFRTEKPMTAAQQQAYVRHQGELELVRDADALWLELHTAVVPNYYAAAGSDAGLWDRAVSLRLVRRDVTVLGPADELAALCVHGSKHRWSRLTWILDVAMLARTLDAADWNALVQRSRRNGTLRMVRLGLLVAANTCGAAFPYGVDRVMREDSVALRLARHVESELFTQRLNVTDGLLFHARMRERSLDQLRYLVNVAFTPSGADWETMPLPGPLFPLYSVTRPARLALKYGLRLLRR